MILREQVQCVLVITFLGYVACKVNEDATTGTKCLKDKAFKDYSMNVYYCDDEAFPSCCERDFTYDCCEDEGEKNWREQLILWGSVLAVIVLILVVCLCFWKEDLCSGKSVCKRWKEKKDAEKYEDKKPIQESEVVSASGTPVPPEYENTSPLPYDNPTDTDGDSGRNSSNSLHSQKPEDPKV